MNATPTNGAPRPGKQAIFEQFAADGFTRMFGNPGTVEQGFLDELRNATGMEYVLALQEAVAVGIADGYARASGGPALVQLHTGVGLGNGVGMLYQAMRGHSPLVVIAGDAGVRYDAMDGQMAADLVGMARPVTKWATRVTHPDSVLRVLRRAVKTAMTPPRGPVFVALPMDVLDDDTAEPAVPSTLPSRAVLPVPAELTRAAALLRDAENPIVLMGDGVSVSGAQAELARVAELLGAPVWGVNSSELNMDTTHPLYRGETGHMFGEVSARIVGDADAVLIVGTAVFPEVFPLRDSPFRQGSRIVHIDLDDYEIAKNFPVDVALVADPKPTLRALADRISGRGRRVPAPSRYGDSAEWTRPEPGPDGRLIEHFAAELGEHAPESLIVFEEALTCSPPLLRQIPPRRTGQFFQTRGGSLGIGLPGAIGAKFARPDAEVVGFAGDGGSMYTPQALWTAARYGVAAKFVICNNHRYKLLDLNIEQYWHERGIDRHEPPDGFDLSHPEIDFAALARSLGVEALRVDKPAQVQDAVRRMLAARAPFLIDLVTE
ncbi:thiamine pyrophosphate-binding protein [Actinomadura barringtoniae]|uniref:Thiamine pyrophosphate-binding protein n=1 Tax=Actinomadura barringtoniae TaxID=1427535 RepID=A0A939PGG5_9ACTN|nr:thiamine pyrophosphate-binding protein [Actinomadura barringtoniae]MBO2448759.1 thiamine pyrophosphate-binding protein [Actinomadura barringtoniae]